MKDMDRQGRQKVDERQGKEERPERPERRKMEEKEEMGEMREMREMEELEIPEQTSLPDEEEFEFAQEGEEDSKKEPPERIPSGIDVEALLEAKIRELQAKAEVNTLAKGIEELTKTLKPAPAEASSPGVFSARLSPEEKKKLNEELFSSPNPADLIDSILASKVDSLVGSVATETARKLAEHEKELLRTTSPEFKEFEKEIEEFVQSLPSGQKYMPGVYKYALDQVKVRNIDRLVEKKLAEKLAEKDVSKPIPPRQVQSQSAPGSVPGKPKLYVDPDTWKAEVDRATALGIGPGSSFWDETRKALMDKYSKPRRR